MALYAVSLDEFKQYISNQQDTSDDTDLTVALNGAHRAAENYCQRSFAPAASAAAQLFKGNDARVLSIFDCTTVTAVTVNGTAVTDFVAEPTNGKSWTQQARPYTQLLRNAAYWPSLLGQANISVTATWGWSAVPDEVKSAVRILAKDQLLERQNSGTFLVVGEAKALLDPLRRAEAWGIA